MSNNQIMIDEQKKSMYIYYGFCMNLFCFF
jgi:hypothetical protein